LSILLLSCKTGLKLITSLYALPNKLKEVSGIAYSTQSSLLWFLKIAVNANVNLWLSPKGIGKSITTRMLKNIDWEDY
jgi:hypothetical protein